MVAFERQKSVNRIFGGKGVCLFCRLGCNTKTQQSTNARSLVMSKFRDNVMRGVVDEYE